MKTFRLTLALASLLALVSGCQSQPSDVLMRLPKDPLAQSIDDLRDEYRHQEQMNRLMQPLGSWR